MSKNKPFDSASFLSKDAHMNVKNIWNYGNENEVLRSPNELNVSIEGH